MSFFSGFLTILKKVGSAVIGKELVDIVREMPAKARSWWRGKKIAAIGPTAAGKNSFYRRLKRESIPEEHFQTRGAEKVESFKFRQILPEKDAVQFECKRAINVGGEIDERERYWLQACEDADVIFYIVDVERITVDGCKEGSRVYEDLKWLATNIARMHDRALVHILLNKVDLLLPKHKTLAAVGRHLKQYVENLEETCHIVFGSYRKRVTGITPISMQDEHIFNTAFGAALVAVHSSLTEKR